MKKHLIITASNIDQEYESRKNDYLLCLKSISKMKNLFDSITVIETHFNNYMNDYFNVWQGFNTYNNKGINEFKNIEKFLKESNINDNDIIIKVTGRYEFLSDYFIQIINEYIDVYYKNSDDIYGPTDQGAHTFLFACRKNKLLEFIESLDLNSNDPIEWQFRKFCENNFSYKVDKLDIVAKPFLKKGIYCV